MTELLVGTRKGLFVLAGEPGAPFDVTGRAFAGDAVEYALRDPRSGRVFASVTSPFYGPKICYSDDLGGDWEQAEGVELPESGDAALERIWVIVPGEADGQVLRRRRSRRAVREPRRRRDVQRSTGRCSSIRPGRRGSLAPAGCACTRSSPGRASPTGSRSASRPRASGSPTTAARVVAARQRGPRRELRARRRAARADRLLRPPPAAGASSDPSGSSCSSTAASTAPTTRARRGASIADGLPSDFGFPLALDPADPDSAYVIPLVADIDRVTPDGRMRVYETRDAGATLDGARRRPAAGGRLPDDAARGVRLDRRGAALELYFGATSGTVYGSADAGASWFDVARTCRRCCRSPPSLERQLDAERRALAGRRADLEPAVERVDAVAQAAQAAAGRRVRAADAVVADLDAEPVVLDREHDGCAARVRVLRHVRERLGRDEVGRRLDRAADGHAGTSLTETGTGARLASASSAAPSPRSLSSAGWMPRASSRSSLTACCASSRAWASSRAAPAGSVASCASASPSVTATATIRCWAPSCRSRSIRRRSASAASRMR